MEAYGVDDGGDKRLAGVGFGHEDGDGGLSVDDRQEGEQCEQKRRHFGWYGGDRGSVGRCSSVAD